MATSILTPSEITNIADGVDQEVLQDLIEDVERIEIMPRLGRQFYYAIIAAIEGESTTYDDILNAKAYTVSSENFRHQGLRRVIERFALARHVVEGNVIVTPNGFIDAIAGSSQTLDGATRKNIERKNMEAGEAYWREIEHFLNNNASSYPLWNYESGERPQTVRRIRVTHVN